MNAFLWPRTPDQIRRLLTENPIDAVVDSIMPGLEHRAREDAVQMVLKLRGRPTRWLRSTPRTPARTHLCAASRSTRSSTASLSWTPT
jgi:hypothetical protein